jgi:predicted Zn finger-like uncharacterized protein
MQTFCPECTTTMTLSNPGTDPAASMSCGECGGEVVPGAFLCPSCETGLQVNRSLLPPEGGRGRCPECSEVVWVPPLHGAMDATPVPVTEPAPEEESPTTFEPTANEPDPAPVIQAEEEAPEPEEELVRTEDPVVTKPEPRRLLNTEPPAPQGRPGMRMLWGGAAGGLVAAGLMYTKVWVPAMLPWQAAFPMASEASWALLAVTAGALVGLVMGGRKGR